MLGFLFRIAAYKEECSLFLLLDLEVYRDVPEYKSLFSYTLLEI
ncbi:hypothetical protein LEP1GSC193_0327 [Leptospira alstonii serovar Pingchang str. 80-412]|uniref:Uncharacterized protein n=2 Tax=Leptospira alstonii TaxID=28452 RepID=M6CWZ5_9LEPT|nr:hypothetical protein LEP1GSC194_2334 [Leptospira alstonii serovar Sichuan str. 79601]EQA80789.1 hypothetical protein LEP1GSC193_0327 [Leptospira alstonii serovar Pingchang str. 80-412]